MVYTWSVEFAVRHGFVSYTEENVAVDAVKRLFQRLKEAHPGEFDYVELKAARLGAACERTRLVGGAPGLVARLKALPEREPSQLRTMSQAFADWGGEDGACVAARRAAAPLRDGAVGERATGKVQGGAWAWLCRGMARPRVGGAHGVPSFGLRGFVGDRS